MTTLGRLEKVELRDIWESEAQHFTPWLAQEENLVILGDTIGADLELEAQEKNVGPFRADILCKDTGTGDWVLIENQLARTDHIHLGQLLTYAAGLQAVTIVWISAQFTEEHRAALDWLNDITDDKFRFFGLEVELWRIGQSPAAPKFNITSKPNDWSRSIGQAAKRISDGELSETKALQLRYWTVFRDFLNDRGSSIRFRKPLPQHYTNFSVGRSGFWMCAFVNAKKKHIGVELVIGHDQAKPFFYLLHEQRTEIKEALGVSLDWEELPNRKASRIEFYRENTDPKAENDWPAQHAWIADMIERFDKTFRPRIKELDASDWIEAEEEPASE